MGSGSLEKKSSVVQAIHNDIKSLNMNTIGAKSLSPQQQTILNSGSIWMLDPKYRNSIE